jgi:hypothetical protein
LDRTIPPWLIRTFGVVCIVAGTAVLISRLVRGNAEMEHLVAAVVAVLAGAICMPFAKSSRPVACGIQVDSGRLYKLRGIRRKPISGRPRVSLGSTDLRTRQTVYSLYARRSFTTTHVLFQYLTRDEALWALAELNRAMKSVVGADASKESCAQVNR